MTPADLKSARSTLGLSQAGLAARIGVERNTINRWEMGLHPIPRWARLLLAKYLDDLSPIRHTIEIPIIPAIRGCSCNTSRPPKPSRARKKSPRTSS